MKNKESILKEEVFKECLYQWHLLCRCKNHEEKLDIMDYWSCLYDIIKRSGLEMEYLEYCSKK